MNTKYKWKVLSKSSEKDPHKLLDLLLQNRGLKTKREKDDFLHAMILAGEQSLKESITFPMSSTGRTAVMDAPNVVEEEQLEELGLKVVVKE